MATFYGLKPICIVLVLVCGASGETADPPDSRPPQITERIDELLAVRWKQAGVSPAPLAGDAEFLRRASLDLTGVIPSVSEVRAFLSDSRPDKRQRLIDDLSRRPLFATHLANTFRSVMLPENSNLVMYGGNGFRSWLRSQFADDVPYDEMTRKLLTASGSLGQYGPELFYIALESKPEELAASTSRIFLGVQISCAQCHHHPFDHWKTEDFWGYAAFFARLQQPAQAGQRVFQVADVDRGEVKLPNTETVAALKYLTGEEGADEKGRTRRQQLAAWMTAAENPYFARAAVNRVWAQLFGRGLVEPVDDLGAHNPSSHPQLLDELAAWFAESRFNLRQLYTVIAKTRGYQLSSEVQTDSEPAPELFARMAIKCLSAEQIYDCLAEAVRRREPATGGGLGNPNQLAVFDPTRQAFLNKFRAPTQKRTEFQAGIPQALTMMNGALTFAATDLARSDLLSALEAPVFTNEERVEVLFLSVLSRMPSAAEKERISNYLKSSSSGNDARPALADVLWALLNSGEFILNH